MASRTKKTLEPTWKRNARIDTWKKSQPQWVVHCIGVVDNQGYIAQANTTFGIVHCTANAEEAVRNYFEAAFEMARNVARFGAHKTWVSYVGPKHPEE
jgi:hypothetical protein